MANDQIGDVPAKVLGMLADLITKLKKGVITPRQLGLFLKKKNPFGDENALLDWQNFYRQVFGIEIDVSNITSPKTRTDFDRVIVVAQGITLSRAFQACKDRFPSWSYYSDLDQAIVEDDRTADQTYAIRIRDRVEADQEFKKRSAVDIEEKDISSMTLFERLIFELKHFDETGQHLDKESITLCSGSRDFDGGVPKVCWGGGELRVGRYALGDSFSGLRAREVVS